MAGRIPVLDAFSIPARTIGAIVLGTHPCALRRGAVVATLPMRCSVVRARMTG